MTSRIKRFGQAVMNIATAFDGAVSASHAVRNHRKPSVESLRKMGLPDDSFDSIKL